MAFTNQRRTVRIGAFVLLAASLAIPSTARAAFVIVDGLDRQKLRKLQVSVALVRVTGVRVDRTRKRKGYLLHRWLRLKVVQRLFGPAPPATGLGNVPYSPMVNSAWPLVKGKLVGRYFIQAWIKGSPCGLGSTVGFGTRFQLPMTATGRKDPRVAAVKRLLGLVRIAGDKRRLAAFRRAFFAKGSPFLSRLADTVLVRLDKRHARSMTRYLRLLKLVQARRGADPRLGWPILYDVSRFPRITTAAAYRKWRRRSPPKKKLTFLVFRKLLQHRLKVVAMATGANVYLRQLALQELGMAPAVVQRRKDFLNLMAIRCIQNRLRDRSVEIRRSAIRALLTVAKTLRRVDRRRAYKLVASVKAAQRREKSAAERRLIARILRKLWSGRRRPRRRSK